MVNKRGCRGSFRPEHKIMYQIPNGVVVVLKGKIDIDNTYITITTQFGKKKINNNDIKGIEKL
jgi:hypothetical protein